MILRPPRQSSKRDLPAPIRDLGSPAATRTGPLARRNSRLTKRSSPSTSWNRVLDSIIYHILYICLSSLSMRENQSDDRMNKRATKISLFQSKSPITNRRANYTSPELWQGDRIITDYAAAD
jgi:hypothetical protein